MSQLVFLSRACRLTRFACVALTEASGKMVALFQVAQELVLTIVTTTTHPCAWQAALPESQRV